MTSPILAELSAWTYPRNVGARLGLEGLLEVNGGEIPEFRVPSDTVVKDFDVF
ncbi:MAG: hypothetical protein JWP89_3281, partial [Schlesneria sp.]|nr:hypothetical protein [Schlesneria sp.]